jgi:hypothetical protein
VLDDEGFDVDPDDDEADDFALESDDDDDDEAAESDEVDDEPESPLDAAAPALALPFFSPLLSARLSFR